ncbi:MAG: hypothetical protein ACJ767_04330 [Chloroflexota bacterium]
MAGVIAFILWQRGQAPPPPPPGTDADGPVADGPPVVPLTAAGSADEDLGSLVGERPPAGELPESADAPTEIPAPEQPPPPRDGA